MLKSNKLLDAIGMIDDETIIDAKKGKQSSKKIWKQVAAIAACLSIVLTTMSVIFLNQSDYIIDNETSDSGVYDNYNGPILPMTILNDINTIPAKRNINFKFSSDNSELGINCLVSDNYSLTNQQDSDVSVDFAYPLIENFKTVALPIIRLDGKEINFELLCGGYTGEFRGTHVNNNGSLNLKYYNSWVDYKNLLQDESYIKNALSYIPELAQSVVVYKFTDIVSNTDKYPAATIRTTFCMDETKSVVFTYGFEGSGILENGNFYKDFFVPTKSDILYSTPKYLIVLGEDISNYSLQGYQTGSCNSNNKLDGANATVTRYETNLEDVMEEIVRIYFEKNSKDMIAPQISFDVLFEEVCRFFSSYSTLGETPKERYEDNRLEDIINEVPTHPRIMWLMFNVVIPAKTEIVIEAEYIKQGSYNYYYRIANKNLGYDIATTIGSNINFTQMTATIELDNNTEIVRKNFAFNTKNSNGFFEMILNEEYYCLEVKNKD